MLTVSTQEMTLLSGMQVSLPWRCENRRAETTSYTLYKQLREEPYILPGQNSGTGPGCMSELDPSVWEQGNRLCWMCWLRPCGGAGCGGGRGMHVCLCPGTCPSFPKYQIGWQLASHSRLYWCLERISVVSFMTHPSHLSLWLFSP